MEIYCIVGIVTVDDALDVMREEHEEDLQIAGSRVRTSSDESQHVLAGFLESEAWVVFWALGLLTLALVTGANPRVEVLIVNKLDYIREALPEADIYVYDNNSTDRTAEVATAAGAIVRHEYVQGKGNVIRRMFREVEADCYLMADGDDTYPAHHAKSMVASVASVSTIQRLSF